MRRLVLILFFIVAFAPTTAMGQSDRSADERRKDEARSHFDLGLSHFDSAEWGAALAEFLRSRELYPTRAATKDAALCLRKEKRYDEALDMFETLVREFPDLSPPDRALVDKETAELRASVGALEIRGAEAGAGIIVDGRERGNAPLPGTIRVSVGSHLVRVFKEGFLPFERRVDIAGGQTAAVSAGLSALTQSGRLRVVEETGKMLDVLVDGALVGKTPWEGNLALGGHTIVLRGDGALGTQPASAVVKLRESTSLSLRAEPLEASARIEPTPAGASVAVDGVVVGHGTWEGRLRVGRHRLEVGAEGFIPQTRQVSLEKSRGVVVVATLERDPTSPLWRTVRPPHFSIEIEGGFGSAPAYGGDVASCATCSGRFGVGFFGLVRGGYELGSGVGFTIDAGYLRVLESVTRSTVLKPVGRAPNAGTVDDKLRLGGAMLGASAGYHYGESLTIAFRLGAGVFVGTGRDARSGRFANDSGAHYEVSVGEAPSAIFAYVAPEARLGHRFGRHFELSAGVTAIVLAALKKPTWRDASPVGTGLPPDRGDGPATFGSESLAGSTVIVVVPGVGVRYEF
jgi:hypothetical protein